VVVIKLSRKECEKVQTIELVNNHKFALGPINEVYLNQGKQIACISKNSDSSIRVETVYEHPNQIELMQSLGNENLSWEDSK